MPITIPLVLAPYLEPSEEQTLDVVTFVSDATCTWLVLRIMYAAIYGTERNSTQTSTSYDRSNSNNVDSVVLVSFTRPFNFWVEVGKKVGLNLQDLASSNQFIFIDGLTPAATRSQPENRSHVYLKSHQPADLEDAVQYAVSQCASRQSQTTVAAAATTKTIGRTTITFDGLDFLLASQPDLLPVRLAQTLLAIRGQVYHAVIACAADTPLLHNSWSTATPLEKHHRAFLMAMVHQSRFVMQLRGLDTGAAKDVSGVLRISKGGCYDETEARDGAGEGEWLYQTKGDGTVRIWSRGE